MMDLFEAVMARFNQTPNGFHTAVQGRLFHDEAPDGTETPYAVFEVQSGPTDQLFDRCQVEFSIYDWSNDNTAIVLAAAELQKLFDNADLPDLGEHGNLGMERIATPHFLKDGQARRCNIEYEIWIARK